MLVGYMRVSTDGDRQVMERSAVEHERIAECLLAEDLPGAVSALKANWESGMHRILEKLGT